MLSITLLDTLNENLRQFCSMGRIEQCIPAGYQSRKCREANSCNNNLGRS